MTNQSTIDKLMEMRLTAMADAFRNQQNDPKQKAVPFEDRFGMLVDIEFSSRKNNRLKRLIKNAGFDQPDANIVSDKYSCGFPNPLVSSIIVGERYLDYFTTIMEDRLWQLLAKPVSRWRNRSGLSMNAARAA